MPFSDIKWKKRVILKLLYLKNKKLYQNETKQNAF